MNTSGYPKEAQWGALGKQGTQVGVRICSLYLVTLLLFVNSVNSMTFLKYIYNSVSNTKPKARAQRHHGALLSPTQGGWVSALPEAAWPPPPLSISPEQGRGTSRSVFGDRRQAMQASMASCQGSSSASGKSTSCIRILGSVGAGREERDAQSGSETPLPRPAPPHALTSERPGAGACWQQECRGSA